MKKYVCRKGKVAAFDGNNSKWVLMYKDPGTLAFAILEDALGDSARARRIYMRYKHRVILSLPRDEGWTLSLDDVMREVEDIEKVEKETAPLRRQIASEPSPVMSDRGQGVVWDNEPKGERE